LAIFPQKKNHWMCNRKCQFFLQDLAPKKKEANMQKKEDATTGYFYWWEYCEYTEDNEEEIALKLCGWE